ncbi:hypothetical protein BJ741DRAFT_119047 [Chytriomyces cf. hyalinus JEL632]|nr:hypothetical protein BJ741DRAFT_119047 [Chytriomyces cf. hyalinus JEL632]
MFPFFKSQKSFRFFTGCLSKIMTRLPGVEHLLAGVLPSKEQSQSQREPSQPMQVSTISNDMGMGHARRTTTTTTSVSPQPIQTSHLVSMSTASQQHMFIVSSSIPSSDSKLYPQHGASSATRTRVVGVAEISDIPSPPEIHPRASRFQTAPPPPPLCVGNGHLFEWSTGTTPCWLPLLSYRISHLFLAVVVAAMSSIESNRAGSKHKNWKFLCVLISLSLGYTNPISNPNPIYGFSCFVFCGGEGVSDEGCLLIGH